MAGGEGSRLRPITANRPKPLVPICNRPIMEHILGLLARHGHTEVVATTHYLAHEIASYFGDGADFGVRMTYSVEDVPLGTAGSVKKAGRMLDSGEPFLIISGDALTDCDLTRAIEFHKAKGSAATLILYRVPNPLDFGVVITGSDGRITRFLEKPGWSEVFSDTVNTGMYILEPQVLDLMQEGKAYDWSRDIFPKILEAGDPIYGYIMDGYWADVGSLTQYREAQEHMLSGRVDLPLAGEQIGMGVHAGPNCEIDPTASIIPPVLLGANVKVKARARVGPYTVIGDGSFVEEDAVVERSVVWESSYIGPKVSVLSAIVGARATIKKDSMINEDAVVGDRCLIDVGSVIRPRVKLWPDKIIERGSTVTMSLVWGSKWRGTLFRELGVAGLSNIEITPDFAVRIGAAFGSQLPFGSRVAVSRDSTRSSRMVKRAVMSALLSVGCNVLDLRGMAAPIARHFLAGSDAAGAVNVRKLPGNSRVSLIEMFDGDGAYLSQGMERKVETAFFREDFTRTDPDDLGVIESVSHAIEDYQRDFFKKLVTGGPRLRVVVDYGYTALGPILPPMLARLGVESLSLNSFNDAKLAPRTSAEIERHARNLSEIVTSLGYDMGVLITNEGERLTVVDDTGAVQPGSRLLAAMCLLVAKTQAGAAIALQVTASERLIQALEANGAKVLRTKAGARALMGVATKSMAAFAGDDSGGFIFPEMHPGFDGPFSLGRLITMLQGSRMRLSQVIAELPQSSLAYDQAKVAWEAKGAIMRRLTEELSADSNADLLDGVKYRRDGQWVLVLPDAFEPLFHVHAEAESDAAASDLVREFIVKIEAMKEP